MMAQLHPTPLLWLVAFQMALHALVWLGAGLLLRESRRAVAHWAVFLLLMGAGLMLAAQRGDPRLWLHFNGANLVTIAAFALMRRGTESFMGLPRHDAEQLAVLTPVVALIALAGPGEATAPLRVVAAYLAQAFIMLRTMGTIHRALRQEFGRAEMLAVVVPGSAIAVALVLLAAHQVLQWPKPAEMQTGGPVNFWLMVVYLAGSSLFSFVFMVMLTQRLVAHLRRASVRDPLTGLYNRRAIAEALERHWLRHRRGQQPLAVLLIDIDHFKRINDTLGHAAGDSVLMHLSSLLQRHVRAEDIVGRMGGEEFLLVLPDTLSAQALSLAERLRALVRAEALGTTISIGIAMARTDDEQAENVIARADAALYRAKEGGRNRIELDA